MRTLIRSLLSVPLAALAPSVASAQGLPPWVPGGRPDLPEEARSVDITRSGEPVFVQPSATASRRGALALGARLPIFGVAAGAGCRGDWLLVGPEAWMCSEGARVSEEQAPEAAPSPGPITDGMPYGYYVVGADGAFGYDQLLSAEETRPAAELQPGFFVAIVSTGHSPSGDPFGLTTKRLWLPLQNLARVEAAPFSGYEVPEGRLDQGWVVTEGGKVFDAPRGHPRGDSRRRFERFTVLETRTERNHLWVKIADGAWLDGDDVRIPALAAPPPEVRKGERWIDVDLGTQTVTAYEGERPIFATLASTGIGRGDDPTATPVGVHRIWVKLRTTDMTNLEDEDARRYYAIEEVPWVAFFQKGYGLHGAFWHHSFGHVRSHGCVNLSPRDAERIFSWAGPVLPPGWTAVLPTEYDPGTLVRVR